MASNFTSIELLQIKQSGASTTNSIIKWDGTKWAVGNDNGVLYSGGAVNKVAYFSATDTITSNANLHFDPTNVRISIGNTSPSAKLHITGEGITSATFGLRVDDSASNNILKILDNGVTQIGKNFTILSNVAYSVINTGNLGTGVYTVTNGAGGNIANIVSTLNSTITLAGSNAFTNAMGINQFVNNTNTSTSNNLTGINLEVKNTNVSARASTITGMYVNAATGSATGGTASFVNPLFVAGGVGAAGATATNVTLLYLQSMNNQGTVTQGYGLYIGDQSTGIGTYTNRSYAIFQEGVDDRNLFAAQSGFGIDPFLVDPSAKIHIGAVTTSAGSAPIKFEAGTLMTTPEPGAVEWDGTNLYLTTSGGVRQAFGLGGGATYSYTVVTTTGPTYNAIQTGGDVVILCNATGGNITVNLPTAVSNTAKFNIKKIDASANTVTVDGSGAQTIDGATTAVMLTQYASISIINDNANWFVV